MEKIEIVRYMRNNKLVRILCAPAVVVKRYIQLRRFSRTQDSKFIRNFKGKYKGKRCFIIGNGPSLTGGDLDLIKGNISFACNRIYNIFDQTTWRPDFWMCVDADCITEEIENIKALKGPIKFLRDNTSMNHRIEPKDEIHRFVVYDKFMIDKASFVKKNISTECDRYFSVSFTVTCLEIEFAIYMGFEEIYLLGVDHNYPISIDKNGNTTVDNTVKSHFTGGGSKNKALHTIYLDSTTQCYQVYRDYADAHGIRIYNATRGGKLEVFERVKLENVL